MLYNNKQNYKLLAIPHIFNEHITHFYPEYYGLNAVELSFPLRTPIVTDSTKVKIKTAPFSKWPLVDVVCCVVFNLLIL